MKSRCHSKIWESELSGVIGEGTGHVKTTPAFGADRVVGLIVHWILIGLSLSGIAPVIADDAGGAAATPNELQEVVVTAQKRAETLEKGRLLTPISCE